MIEKTSCQAISHNSFTDSCMTMRDYFAAKAMAALINISGVVIQQDIHKISKLSFQFADEMLRLRVNKKDLLK